MKLADIILMDLDGTLIDSAPGIIYCYKAVAKELKVPAPSTDMIRTFIGYPLRQNLATYIPHNRREEAVELYFDIYDNMRLGLVENRVYDGVIDALHVLKSNGKRLILVTTKLQDFVLPILSYFGLEVYFEKVYAAGRGDNNLTKDLLISNAIREMGLVLSNTIKIGDRAIDVVAAHENGVRAVAVTWGYGSEDELKASNPDILIQTPEQLVKILV